MARTVIWLGVGLLCSGWICVCFVITSSLIEAHLNQRDDAAAAPNGLDELVYQFEFGGSLGLEFIENFLSQIFEDAGVC